MKENFFTYKNLGGEYAALENDIRLGTPTAAFGVSDTHKYLLAALSQKSLYITADAPSAAAAYAAISTLSGKKCVYLPAKDDVVLYKGALSKDVTYRRISALSAILDGADIVVCEIEALMQLVPAKVDKIALKVGEEYDFSSLPERLVKMGYTREYAADTAGLFAIRGDILDVFPVGAENPVRVDFFGDTIEKIRPYDAQTGERLPEKKAISIISATDAPFEAEEGEKIRAYLRQEAKKCADIKGYERACAIADEIGEKMAQGVPFSGASFVLPLLNCPRTMLEITAFSQIIFDECKSINDRANALYKEHIERVNELKKGGEVFEFSKAQLIEPSELFAAFTKYPCLALQNFMQSTYFFRPLKTYNLHATPAPSYINSMPQFVSDAKNWLRNGYRVIAFAGSVQRLDKLNQILADEYLPVQSLPDRFEALQDITTTSEELSHGIVLHECKLAIVGSGDLYTKTVTKRIKKKRGDLFVAPEIGDFCVHEKHGIGKILGTEKIETTDGIKEYISIEYKGGNLFVPVEQMDILSKYVGDSNPQLSKIGGAEFERVKERVRQSIKSLAFDLKELYAERAKKQGFAFPENEVMMEEFEEAFEYEETADQLSSIAEIKSDMCSTKVMDRLLCGDVGYGKTEVALRAVYLCVLGCKQAAIMCPSTVLSEQHYNTAVKRFAPFGVRVEVLNRFKTAAQQAKILRELKEGNIDLIVGTHRLLSDDVKFNDLGLLVLDEEQRFGVEHKEKIKNVKKNIDCLTMTATPIPRTLHMSLAGIRDISTINTPPLKRLPVQTYVLEESEPLIRDAVLREISRGGQVFILYNRVESISSFTGRITEIVPEAKVCYAHGRMDRETLENSVYAFYRGEKNVLVTTTIIENGIDLPNANTIIVIDADRLGVSQLYQLRGRVGRGSRLAQAYFTFKPSKVLTADATERLKAIMRFTELGSGFKIAMRDLEIRGAGNMFSAEQHGHMDKIGYELYSKLLKEEFTGEKQLACELDIAVSAYIPEKYVESSAARMECYKEIAEIHTAADYKRVCVSIEDNYGAMPDEVFALLLIATVKAEAVRFNVRKITVNKNGGVLELPSVQTLNDNRLAAALDKYKGSVSLSMSRAPEIVFAPRSTHMKTLSVMGKFLNFALTFK